VFDLLPSAFSALPRHPGKTGRRRPLPSIVDLRLDALYDGIDVIERVRQRLGPELSAMLISGDTGAAEISRVKSIGLPLLTKPVSPARLKSALHAYLSTAPEAAAGAG
jgi:CheY-like chemotaxis protein